MSLEVKGLNCKVSAVLADTIMSDSIVSLGSCRKIIPDGRSSSSVSTWHDNVKFASKLGVSGSVVVLTSAFIAIEQKDTTS